MVEQAFTTLLKQAPLQVEVGQMIQELRSYKKLTQNDISQLTDMPRQTLSELENGRISHLDLEKIRKIVNVCGEQLYITTSFENPLQISDRTEREDAVLIAFASGDIKTAEELLRTIRRWHYPSTHLTAQCKRNIAIAVSYHFKGMETRSKLRMSDLVFGLSYIGCDKEAERFIEMYDRTIDAGEKAMTKKKSVSFKKGAL